MTLKLDLPPELERDAIQITDLKERLTLSVRHQVDVEHWRSAHYSSEAQRLVAESAPLAVGLTPEAAVVGFMELHDRITAKVKE